MAEIDPVILELRADLLKYQADLRKQATDTDRQLGRQEKAVQRLEAQMKRSSGAISGSLRGIAGTLGTYFTGRELVGLIDGFTRLQNNLKVAGLEGASLEQVQSRLLDLSTRYGVGIESLADLFGKATQAGKDLGASQEQLLSLTEATSQALLITGTSSQQASGAILGLTQALASGTVRAEEFNQINEGGLRPLLQAAAASEKYGGSVAKLRAAVIDGKVSSQEFYQSILNGSQQLETQASKATLTVAGAFEALTSRLTVYIGQSAQVSGATQAIAGAMQLLADNLETIIPLLAIIGVAAFGRFAAGALAGGVALRNIAAYASIATTSLAGTALAARSAGAALLGALGGPVGIAITALIIGLALASQEVDKLAGVSANLRQTNDQVTKAADATRSMIDRLASSYGKARVEALALAEAQRKLLIADVIKAGRESTAARKAVSDAESSANGGKGAQGGTNFAIDAARRDRKAAEDNERIAYKNLRDLETAMAAPPITASGGASGGKPTKKSGGRSSGPSASEIEARFNQELSSLAQQTLSSRQQMATSADERAELELRSVELARVAALESLKADKDYNAAQKERVKDALDNLAEIERARIARELRIQQEEEAADLAEANFRAQSDALRQQYDLAKSQTERRELAYEIIDLEYRERDAALERIKNNEDLSKAVRDRAAIEQAALRAAQGRTKEAARRDTAGPLEQYFDRAKKDAAELNELYEGIAVDGLQRLNDGLTDAIVNSKSLGDVFKNVAKSIIADLIRIAIQQTIVNALGASFGGGSGGGGFFSSIFGRASGGYVAPGQTVRVNEQRGGAEYLRMGSQGGTVIPLGQINQRAMQPAGQGGGITTVRLALSGDIDARIDQRAVGVAVEVVRATAGEVSDLGAQKALHQISTPRL